MANRLGPFYQQFKKFCRNKPREERYVFYDTNTCPVAQFCDEKFENWGTEHRTSTARQAVYDRLHSRFGSALINGKTYGALADRIEGL